MNELNLITQPELKNSIMIASWKGWPDAVFAASEAVQEIVNQQSARLFANIDPEGFFSFTDLRPTINHKDRERSRLTWPSANFYYIKSSDINLPDLVLFEGDEPHLYWRRYCDLFTQIASACDVQTLITCGSLLDYVPHTVAAQVSCVSSSDQIDRRLAYMNRTKPSYEGPAAISSAIGERFQQAGVTTISLWGHSPHYSHLPHNPALTIGMLKQLAPLLPKPLETSGLESEVVRFQEAVEKEVREGDLEEYVGRLEDWFNDKNKEQLFKDLEDFLSEKKRGHKNS